MTNQLSVVIVTKNRADELSHCLGSLLSNDILPDEIVVVDNNSTDKTKQLIEGLKIQAKVKVNYVFFDGKGYPAIYNKGLQIAKNNWVAFIDDDCVADSSWVSEINKSINKNPNIDVVMGWCGTYFSQNVYSQATILFDNEWKRRGINDFKVIDFEILDNKNIVYKKDFLNKNFLEYDEKRSKYQNGAAEDSDLGMQIQQANGKAIFNNRMKVLHKDPQNWIWYMKKNITSWKSYQSLSYKWDLPRRETMKLSSKSLKVLVGDIGNKLSLSLFNRMKLFFICKQVMILTRILPILYFNKKYNQSLNEK